MRALRQTHRDRQADRHTYTLSAIPTGGEVTTVRSVLSYFNFLRKRDHQCAVPQICTILRETFLNRSLRDFIQRRPMYVVSYDVVSFTACQG